MNAVIRDSNGSGRNSRQIREHSFSGETYPQWRPLQSSAPQDDKPCKIFAPFAALVGFDERVRAKEIDYTARRELAEGETAELNATLSLLARGDCVKIMYFEACHDHENDAFGRLGLYKTARGIVRWVDAIGQVLYLEDRSIDFSDLYQLEMG